MMRFGMITLCGAAIGTLWGAVWMIVIGVLLMLVSGLIVQPPVLFAMGLGCVLGILSFWIRSRWSGNLALAIHCGVALAGLLALTLGQPFGVDLGQKPIYQIAAALILASAVGSSIHFGFNGYTGETVSRYRAELLLIRLMKGLGFVIFTIVVALPFYVMVMTSLKSQQSLLSNPLDFSIDLTQGGASLFLSLIHI